MIWFGMMPLRLPRILDGGEQAVRPFTRLHGEAQIAQRRVLDPAQTILAYASVPCKYSVPVDKGSGDDFCSFMCRDPSVRQFH